MKKEWYVVQVYSGSEYKARDLLKEKIKIMGVEHLFGRILIPEEVQVDFSNRNVERVFVSSDAQLYVKSGKDIKRGELLAKEPDVVVKHDGVIKEVKSLRMIVIVTRDKKYTKTFWIPESAGVVAGLRVNTKITQGKPLARKEGYESDVDGVIASIDKVKRIVVKRDDGEEDVYIAYSKNFDSKSYKSGTPVKAGELLAPGKEYRAKYSGKVDVKEYPVGKEIRIMKTVRTKLFPGYMFIEMVMNNETMNIVKGIPYVITFIHVGGNPVKLNKREVMALLRISGEEKYEPKPGKIRVDYSVGEMVKIISGPFEYFTAKIIEIDPHKQTVKVAVSIFGRETAVELSLSEIEKIV